MDGMKPDVKYTFISQIVWVEDYWLGHFASATKVAWEVSLLIQG